MPWRLLHGDDPAEGARNMAVDEALLLSALAGEAPPTLRLYRFREPTLTFGYGQLLEEVCRPHVCRSLGVGVVRRLTGGRALLHQHELTYSVTSAASGPFGGLSVREVYAAVSAALVQALSMLGVPVDPEEPGATHVPRAASAPLACLAYPDGHEITSGGQKIVASAQRRRRGGFLQHGAILRRVDPSLWERIRPAADDAPLDAVGIDETLAVAPSLAELESALRDSFTELFGEPPSASALTTGERQLAGELEAKYRSREWTLYRRLPAVDNSQPAW